MAGVGIDLGEIGGLRQTYGATFETLTASAYFRFGVQARNKTGTTVDLARVRMLLDITFSG